MSQHTNDNQTQDQQMLNRYSDVITGVFGTPARALVKGEGVHVWDADGNRYTDFLAGIAVNALGHGHPKLIKAVTEQLQTLGHISNLFTSPAQIGLAEKLLELAGTPEGSVFFANSGTEANEAAFKLARRYADSTGGKKHRIIALKNAFHGRTMGALALTWKPEYKAPFEPLPTGVEHILADSIETLENTMGDDVAALILEPVQGEAGVLNFPAGYLEAARNLCDAHGALLIFDEVQSGIGRTGTWFGFQNPQITGSESPVIPDAFTLAKGLGGGVPVGAMVSTNARTSALLTAGQHGTTFGGNPMATAAGLAVIDIIESDNLLAHVKELGDWLARELQALDEVKTIRAYGLWIGVDLDIEKYAGSLPEGGLAAAVVKTALDRGMILNATGPATLRLAPPLIMQRSEAQPLIDSLPDLVRTALNA